MYPHSTIIAFESNRIRQFWVLVKYSMGRRERSEGVLKAIRKTRVTA